MDESERQTLLAALKSEREPADHDYLQHSDTILFFSGHQMSKLKKMVSIKARKINTLFVCFFRHQ